MESATYGLIHQHKLPSKLVKLLKEAEVGPIVGFGATQEQRDIMLLTAVVNSQSTAYFEELKQEFDEYFLTLSNSLIAN